MTPLQFKRTRKRLGLSVKQLTAALGLSLGRSVRHYQSGERSVSGTIAKLLQYIERYGVLKDD